jgi:hypothetical protein
MWKTRRVLEFGPLAVEVPAVASVGVLGDGRFAAWSSEALLTVSVGRYSASINEEGNVVLRKYESPPSPRSG